MQQLPPNVHTDDSLTMLVGTYTYDVSHGIYSFRFNQESGEYQALHYADAENPSYLAISSDNKRVYSITEKGDDSKINVHSIDIGTGIFSPISCIAAKADPCHIMILPNGDICASNYTDGSISIYHVDSNGTICDTQKHIKFYAPTGPNVRRRKGVHIHFSLASPDGKYLYSNDLGTDRIHGICLTGNHRRLPDTIVQPGYGPRHSVFSSDGEHLYLLNELSGHIVAYLYHKENGILQEQQDLMADEADAHGSADICLSNDNRFLYASHRLINDGISIFAISSDGTLRKIGYHHTGKHPRGFAITPNDKYLLVACRDDNAIQILKRNATTGILTDTGKRIPVPRPVCIKLAKQ